MDVVEQQGELALFRTFQKQPAQRERPVEAQLRRFLGTHSGRKAQYARALVEALPPGVAPSPLEGLLERSAAGRRSDGEVRERVTSVAASLRPTRRASAPDAPAGDRRT